MKHYQSGRTLIEMLAILAIIGLLSVSGLQLYAKAMNSVKVNRLMEKVYLLANQIRNEEVESSRQKNTFVLPDASEDDSYGFVLAEGEYCKENKEITVTVKMKDNGVFTAGVCKLLKAKLKDDETLKSGLKNIKTDKGNLKDDDCLTVKSMSFVLDSSFESQKVEKGTSSGQGGTGAGNASKSVTCQIGYYKSFYDDGEAYCKRCPAGKTSPSEATSEGDCYGCNSNQYGDITATGCKKCPDNAICNGGEDFSCSTDGHFYKTTDGCPVCPNKATCDGSTNYTCYKNGTYYYKKDGACVNCPDNAICNGGEEFSCQEGHYKNGDTCPVCPKNATCTTVSFSCNAGYYKDKTACAQCPDGRKSQIGSTSIADCKCPETQYYNGSKCVNCPENGNCDGTESLYCKKGFYLTEANTCVQCPDNAHCNGTATYTCLEGYYRSGVSCLKCPANAECNGDDSFSCDEAFYKKDGVCVACPENAYCYGTEEFSCKTGYYKAVDSCTDFPQPTANCAKWTESTCTACEDGYTLSGNVCYATIANCATQTGDICSACNAGYTLSGNACTITPIANCKTQNGTTCTECNSGYAVSGNACVTAIENCKTYKGTSCTVCNDGFVPSGNTCVTAIANCKTYSSTTCSECETGYTLSDDKTTCSAPVLTCTADSTDYLSVCTNQNGGNGYCVSGSCKMDSCFSNDDCAGGQFCKYGSLKGTYKTRSVVTVSGTTATGTGGYQGVCTALGDSTTGTLTGYVKSSSSLNWWSAKNWCEAKGMDLFSLSGNPLQCYDGTTAKSFPSSTERCCAYGESGSSCTLSAPMQNLKSDFSGMVWTDTDISDANVYLVYSDKVMQTSRKSGSMPALCE